MTIKHERKLKRVKFNFASAANFCNANNDGNANNNNASNANNYVRPRFEWRIKFLDKCVM